MSAFLAFLSALALVALHVLIYSWIGTIVFFGIAGLWPRRRSQPTPPPPPIPRDAVMQAREIVLACATERAA